MTSGPSTNRFFVGLESMFRQFHVRHERLKNTVHTAWRVPLPPAGIAFMGLVYFSIPVVGGWYVMQWAISKSHQSIGERGEYLPVQTAVLGGITGDKIQRVVQNENGESQVVEKRIGAGGWGGGVHLAVSDEETQKRNRQMLGKFLKQQRRKHEKEKEEAN